MEPELPHRGTSEAMTDILREMREDTVPRGHDQAL